MSRYQLLIRKNPHDGMPVEEIFAHGECHEVDSLPYELSLDRMTCTLVEQDSSGEPRLLLSGYDGGLLLNGKEIKATEPIVLHNGDALVVGQLQIQFFHTLKKIQVAASANLLGNVSKIVVLVLIVLEFVMVAMLPFALRKFNFFNREYTLNQLTKKIDLCTVLCDNLHGNDAIVNAYYEALREEVKARVHYVRRYSSRLTDEQLKMHLDNMNRLEVLLKKLRATPELSAEDNRKQIDLNIPVRKILQDYK